MSSVTEYKIGRAIVRVHPGKCTEEERKEAFERAAIQFTKAVEKKSSGYWKRYSATYR